MQNKLLILLVAVFCFTASPSYALISPEEQAESALIEEQAKDIFKQLRCLVCDNQTIDSSDSEMSSQLRNTIRSMLEKGDSPQEVLLFVHENYGDKILYNPPLSSKTLFLWAFPFLFLGAGIFIMRKFYK